MPYFDTVDDAIRALADYGYIADRQLATAVFVQTRLDKPLLVEGPAEGGSARRVPARELEAAAQCPGRRDRVVQPGDVQHRRHLREAPVELTDQVVQMYNSGGECGDAEEKKPDGTK